MGHYGIEGELKELRRDRNMLMAEIVKLRQQQQDSNNLILAMNNRIQSTETKQQNIMSFVAKAFSNPTLIRQYMDKYVQKIDPKQIEMGRKRRLTMRPSVENLQDQTLDNSSQQEENLGNIITEMESFLSAALDNESSNDKNAPNVSTSSGDLDAFNETLWEELLNDDLRIVNE